MLLRLKASAIPDCLKRFVDGRMESAAIFAATNVSIARGTMIRDVVLALINQYGVIDEKTLEF